MFARIVSVAIAIKVASVILGDCSQGAAVGTDRIHLEPQESPVEKKEREEVENLRRKLEKQKLRKELKEIEARLYQKE